MPLETHLALSRSRCRWLREQLQDFMVQFSYKSIRPAQSPKPLRFANTTSGGESKITSAGFRHDHKCPYGGTRLIRSSIVNRTDAPELILLGSSFSAIFY